MSIFIIHFLYHYLLFSSQIFQHTLERGVGSTLGLVQTLVAPGAFSLLLSFSISAEYVGLAGMIGDRQHTLQ